VLLYDASQELAEMSELQLKLSAEEIDRIVGFLGYGQPSAPVWFIGIEEGLGKMDSEDIEKNLKARASFAETMDLREAHLRLLLKGKPIDVEKKPPPTQVWQYMAKIMRAYGGNKDWIRLESAKEYIRSRLGRHHGETFLTELSPIPSKNGKDKTWLNWFRREDPGLNSKILQRAERLKQALVQNRPPLVMCYGNGNNLPEKFADLLGVEWQPVCPNVCASRDYRRLLLPFFGTGQLKHSVIEEIIHRGLLGSVAALSGTHS
jgi:hypothetical protein